MLFRLSLLTLFLTVLTGIIFAAWPGIDLAVSKWFFTNGAFYGQGTLAQVFRKFFFYLPIVVILIVFVAWMAPRLGRHWPQANWYAPSTRNLLFSVLALALGPGVFVNLGLKDHWDRPRPVHVKEFGGTSDFKPWWRTDGNCRKNCSFVSGEVAGNFWLVAPASLLPAPARTPAVIVALAAGTATAVGRVAFGGHFLSDVIFAALFTFLICQGLYFLMIRRGRKTKPTLREKSG